MAFSQNQVSPDVAPKSRVLPSAISQNPDPPNGDLPNHVLSKNPASPDTIPPQVRILTAHTCDDMLETSLMRVLRGSGPCGLAAMPVSRGRFLRPMLGLSRRDVLSYLAEKKLAWREDSTNADTLYFRNRVRHRLVPALAENFPGWRGAVCAFAKTQSLAADFIVGEANSRVKWRPVQADSGSVRQNTPALCTSEGNFFAQPEIIREEALFQGIDLLFSGALPGSGGVKAAKSGVKRSNIRLFSQGTVTHIDLGGLHLQRKAGMVSICRRGRENTVWESGFSLLIIAGGSYNLKGTALSVERVVVASLEADASCEAVSSSITGTDGRGETVFFALLPFVLRPAFKEDRITCAWHGSTAKAAKTGRTISAVDSLGIAAFIGTDGLLESRRTAAGFKAALDSEGADRKLCSDQRVCSDHKVCNLAVCTVKIGKQKELET